MHRGGRLRPGDWAALCLVAEAFAIDAVLIKGKQDTISTCIRSSMLAKVVAVGLTAHLIANLPFDPISRSGEWLERWYATRVPTG